MRGTVDVPVNVSQEAAMEAARQVAQVAKQIEGKEIKKVIWVPGKIINIIIGK
jgi:leucyl-tRNA synthetase